MSRLPHFGIFIGGGSQEYPSSQSWSKSWSVQISLMDMNLPSRLKTRTTSMLVNGRGFMTERLLFVQENDFKSKEGLLDIWDSIRQAHHRWFR